MIPGARWVWDTADFDNGGDAIITRTIVIPAGASNIQAYVDSGFDDSGEVIVNGQNLGGGGSYYYAGRHNISNLLRPGENTIVLHGYNGNCNGCTSTLENPGGVIGKLTASWTIPDNRLNLTGDAMFSPLVKKNQLAITADGAWILSVDGKGQITSGSGTTPYLWDGTVNGATSPLADGRYTLRLSAEGVPDKTIEVVIDQTKPVISASQVSHIRINPGEANQQDPNLFYTVNVTAKDAGDSSLASGIAADSAKVLGATPAFSEAGTSAASGQADTYEVPLTFKLSAVSSGTLSYSVTIADAAGNASNPLPVQFTQTAEGTIDTGLASAENVSVAWTGGNASAYSVLAKPVPEPAKREDNFYLKSGFNYHLRGGILVRDGEKPVPPGPLAMDFGLVCVNKYVGKKTVLNPMESIYRHEAIFHVNNPYTERFDIQWDGKEVVNGRLPDGIPEGTYIVWVYLPSYDLKGRDISPEMQTTFKVSHRDVIKLGEWASLDVPTVAFDRAAHIIDNHVLEPDTSRPIVEVKEPEDLFSYYTRDPDDLMNVNKNIFYAPRTARLQGYSEDNDPGFIMTKELMSTDPTVAPIYQAVAKMGESVLKFPTRSEVPRNARDAYTAPIVFPNGRVVWVRNINAVDRKTKIYHRHYNIFPDYVSQKAYEDSIRNKW